MKHILEKLNKIAGIRGSMVMTQDGIMVAEALGPDLEDDVVAALASALLVGINKSLTVTETDEKVEELILTASDGKMVFINLENAYLVVMAKHNMEIATTMVEIKSAAHKINNRRPTDVKYQIEHAG